MKSLCARPCGSSSSSSSSSFLRCEKPRRMRRTALLDASSACRRAISAFSACACSAADFWCSSRRVRRATSAFRRSRSASLSTNASFEFTAACSNSCTRCRLLSRRTRASVILLRGTASGGGRWYSVYTSSSSMKSNSMSSHSPMSTAYERSVAAAAAPAASTFFLRLAAASSPSSSSSSSSSSRPTRVVTSVLISALRLAK
mmetsp:Transcript_31008/g.75861  ORF Transcript_31008/g.75861 Transcript_31008/m.75861 type:complete len:202 (-) Transcript_31008:689-1294(-)